MIAFVQARMGSTRMPGKILRLLPDGQTLLEQIFDKISKSGNTPYLITSTNPENQPLINLAKKHSWLYFLGDEDDVLQRFISAAGHFNIQDNEQILRICADNPFISHTVIEQTVRAISTKSNLDYFSLGYQQIPGIKLHAGIFVEAVRISALKSIHRENNEWFNEHVTLGIYTQPDQYNIEIQEIPEDWQPDFLKIRLTMDDDIDWQLITEIYPQFHSQDFSEFKSTLLSNKNWVNLMSQQINKYQK